MKYSQRAASDTDKEHVERCWRLQFGGLLHSISHDTPEIIYFSPSYFAFSFTTLLIYPPSRFPSPSSPSRPHLSSCLFFTTWGWPKSFQPFPSNALLYVAMRPFFFVLLYDLTHLPIRFDFSHSFTYFLYKISSFYRTSRNYLISFTPPPAWSVIHMRSGITRGTLEDAPQPRTVSISRVLGPVYVWIYVTDATSVRSPFGFPQPWQKVVPLIFRVERSIWKCLRCLR